ncbi:type IV pilin PilA [Candidatus Nitrosoglobus terrae]|uniref:Type IV pilin PilA n=1 Tax=Candidatus Nitrosoglobus terrae TaxID=1630141 RepID=A0A1Q2SLF3_9GAMM|nr:pilin [Candidatus Nitrosoglobus terrae]BAW79952.1 type IV pilin PilA [Candidatus Nitrosoglobus terrae]
MNHIQQGFTLIELLVGVAILGVITATAVPWYRTYLPRTQVARAIVELSEQKGVVEQCLGAGLLNVGAGLGACDPTAMISDILAGNPPQGSTVAPQGAVGGFPIISSPLQENGTTIQAEFGNQASPFIQGKTLTFTRSQGGTWRCRFSGDSTYAPTNCPAEP